MAKTTTGILGAYSGTIGDITGYRRQALNIITAKPRQQNKALRGSMLYRNNFKNTVINSQSTIGATAFTRYVKGLIGTHSLSERIGNTQRDWELSKYTAPGKILLLNYTDTVKNGLTYCTYSNSPKLLSINFANVEHPLINPSAALAWYLFINLSQSKYFGSNRSNVPTLHSGANLNQTLYNTGDYVFFQFIFVNTLTANPSWSIALPGKIVQLK